MLTSVTGVFLVACIIELLRRRKLKEKYAFLWVLTGLVIIPLGFFPSGLDSVASAVGVRSGVSLLLFLSVAFLFIVCLQLSWEVGHLEEEGRTLSEEVALLRIDVTELRKQLADNPPAGASAGTTTGEAADRAGQGSHQ
ncbi:DUF2304 domain-containing protein [Streptomyces sp. NPDC090025]|uniref:DUF2304 domain-containing protein n=1 Tax=Streptomyces sp. NPDC090025 TaxID=3365922 RepID=UPI0038391FCA